MLLARIDERDHHRAGIAVARERIGAQVRARRRPRSPGPAVRQGHIRELAYLVDALTDQVADAVVNAHGEDERAVVHRVVGAVIDVTAIDVRAVLVEVHDGAHVLHALSPEQDPVRYGAHRGWSRVN